MIAWWWLLIAGWVGGIVGYFMCALMVIASEGRQRERLHK
jgi:hypothetical protein